MRKYFICFFFILPTFFVFGQSQSNVYYRGEMNSWGASAMTPLSIPTGNFTWFITIASDGNDDQSEFKFANTTNWTGIDWSRGDVITINSLTDFYQPNGGNGKFNESSTKSYSFTLKDVSAGNSEGFVFQFSSTPVAINNVTESNTFIVCPGQNKSITATLGEAKPSEQRFWLRYSNNSSFSSSTIVEMSGSETSYSASIPSSANTAGATIYYYVFTTGDINATTSNADVATFGFYKPTNYSYTVQSSWTTKSGASNWSVASSWDAGEVPASGQPVTIEDNLTLDQDVSVSSLTINSDKTFTASDATARTLTISSGGTLTNNGTFTAGTGKIVFSGNGSVAGSSATTFNNLEIAGGVVVNGNSTIGNKFTINSGGYLSQTPGGSGIVNESDIPNYSTGATLAFTGTFDVNSLASGWGTSGSKFPSNIAVEGTGVLTLSLTRSTQGNFDVATGATLNANGNLTIISSPTGTGSLITNGTVSGSVKVQRYIPGWSKGLTGFHLLSSPVQNQLISTEFVNVTGSIPSTVDFYYWNEPHNYWINIKNVGLTYNKGTSWENFSNEDNPSFIVGKGYLVGYSANQTDKEFSGIPNTGDLVSGTGIPALTYTSGEGNGWNLIGNPYPSAIDWDLGTWTRTNLNGSVYVQNGATGNYVSWNGSTGGLTNGIIPAMQGFFVKADATGASIKIPNNSRVHSSSNLFKSSSNKSADNVLVFEISSSDLRDQLYLQFSSQATQNYDNEFDAYKLFGTGDSPQIYSNSEDGKILSINVLPQISEEMSVPVNVKIINSGAHEISLSENTLIESLPILLEDKKENRTVELNLNNNYVFEATVGEQPDRFMLHFKSTGISNTDNLLQPLFYYQNSHLNIKNLQPGTYQITISDMTGRQVATKQISADGLIALPLSLQTGIYIVELSSETSKFANKIFIK